MTGETPIVFVVDSDASVREALAAEIRSAGWQPVTVASAAEFLAHPRARAASCLVVEQNLPDSSGLDLQRLVSDCKALQVIFVCGSCDVQGAVQAMKAGAFDLLAKPFKADMLGVIGQAIERSHAAHGELAEMRTLKERYDSLSRREREVLGLVVAGLLNKQVGGELGISEITVKAHRGSVMRKMQARSLADLVRMASTLHLARPVIADRGRATVPAALPSLRMVF